MGSEGISGRWRTWSLEYPLAGGEATARSQQQTSETLRMDCRRKQRHEEPRIISFYFIWFFNDNSRSLCANENVSVIVRHIIGP